MFGKKTSKPQGRIDSLIGAGTTVTGDVPEGALAVTRPEQKHVEGYRDRLEARYVGKNDRSKG